MDRLCAINQSLAGSAAPSLAGEPVMGSELEWPGYGYGHGWISHGALGIAEPEGGTSMKALETGP